MSTPTERGQSSAEGGVSSLTDTDSQANDCAQPAELGLDIVFDALKNGRRRRLLRYLNEESESVELSDLAEHIAAIENDTTPEALDSKQRKRVYVALYQVHLPKLDEMGVLTFNKKRGVIERASIASQLDKYLYDDTAKFDLWRQYYIECLGVSGVVLLLATVTGGIGTIAAVSLFIGTCLGVAGLAAFHTYEQRSKTDSNIFHRISGIDSLSKPIRNGSQPSNPSEQEDETKDSPSTNNMYECPECKTVYLSEKSCICSNCNSKTAAIESTG